MQNFIEYQIENNNILSGIDKSIKKARELEMGKCPYAVVLNPISSEQFKLENLTYFTESGFMSIPIIKHKNIKEGSLKLAYNEESLVNIIKPQI